MRSSKSMYIQLKCVSISCFLCKNLSFLCVEEISFTVQITKSDSLQFRFEYLIIINDATAITIFFRRQAEKSLGLLRIKLQKLTFCRNAIYECTVLIYLYLYNRRQAGQIISFMENKFEFLFILLNMYLFGEFGNNFKMSKYLFVLH